MVRRNSSSRNEPVNHQKTPNMERQGVDFDIQQELAHLQEMIYESFHIPLTRWTMIDEGKLLDQLDLIGETIPESIRKALAVLEQEQDILAEAEAYAQRIIQSANQKAAQILDETGIIQQAQQEAHQIRQQVNQECQTIQDQTMAEIEQLRQVTNGEIQQFRQKTLAESQKLQEDADKYADGVLTQLEQELAQMLAVVRNGRQQLYNNSPTRPQPSNANKPPNSNQKRS
ncbi:MAG TPA: hypothetical protein DCF68_19530 [Cyanothece sp. UBA12306]|nr:hypothetical protein [Cyanothece sp. UBA12306]